MQVRFATITSVRPVQTKVQRRWLALLLVRLPEVSRVVRRRWKGIDDRCRTGAWWQVVPAGSVIEEGANLPLLALRSRYAKINGRYFAVAGGHGEGHQRWRAVCILSDGEPTPASLASG